jgi:ABC-type microcin C transport system permease subunit YejB
MINSWIYRYEFSGQALEMIKTKILNRIAKSDYVRSALNDKADLSAFKERPTVRIILGVSAILFSYIISWPAIGALGALSVYLNKPLLVVIGGPLLYGFSHLVFIFGMYLAGAKYSKIFLRWATRIAVEKLLSKSYS